MERPRGRGLRESGPMTFDTVPKIAGVDQLFALALAMERESGRRYAELSMRMEAVGEEALAALFRRLEAEERDHGAMLAEWARQQGVIPAAELPFAWDPPEAPDPEDVIHAALPLSSPWFALDRAVRNEERAYAFYMRLAAGTADVALRLEAERMAAEELSHVARLRLARRRAWPTERAALDGAFLPVTLSASLTPLTLHFDGEEGGVLAGHVARAEAETAHRYALAARFALGTVTGALFLQLAAEARERGESVGAPGMSVAPRPAKEQALSFGGSLIDLVQGEVRLAGRLLGAWQDLMDRESDSAATGMIDAEVHVTLSRLARLSDRLAALKAGQTP
ncbi:Rubrerythrin [Rhodospirillum rubrum ATCC 11170]|uniref:Rubrerythrin n=4 Tax=Rhodospirillum rubrum TaxID=1085 RepID=Q2RRR6_RHORT|nr:ferritin family protein [Rhodospirillum rubrum]ABC23179.1 Rubrerythrin [Rhodospirillum rubrum ATCC 11170]MBK5954819.1 rubrerythrin [Rhodospirillum rubrum]